MLQWEAQHCRRNDRKRLEKEHGRIKVRCCCVIALNAAETMAMALGHVRAGQPQQVRSLVRRIAVLGTG